MSRRESFRDSLRGSLRDRALGILAAPSRWARPRPGTQRHEGIVSGATIRRDHRGIPWVEADNDGDLYFAAGFAQATDRLWQMDVLRRRAKGTLSEIFGAVALPDDVRARKLALERVARASEELLGPERRAALEAFSRGVNTALRRMRRRAGLPPEFMLLRYRPEPWTPVDSLVIVKHLGFDLGVNIKNETFRARLTREHPSCAASFLHPKYPDGGAVTIRKPAGPGSADRAGSTDEAVLRSEHVDALPLGSRDWLQGLLRGEHPIGSNAWAVSGERSATGHPLLANDPHILFTQPSLWYQMGLKVTADGEDAADGYGVTVPGLPGLIAGANRHLAWGITNSTVDTQDLCTLDSLSGAERTWEIESTISVRGGDDVVVRAAGGVRHVEMDPPAADDDAGRYGLFWSGLTPSTEIEGCQLMWRARGYEEFRDALRGFGVPVLNVMVACRDGDIALKTAGLVPARRPASGLAPGAYSEVARSWERFLEFDELPETVNPEEGYIVSANHKLVPDDAPVQVGIDWVAPYRAERIEELILGAGPVTADDCARWQGDTANGRARRVLPALLEALDQQPPEDRLARACHELLKDWDGRDAADQAAPLVFFRLMQVLAEHWVTSRLGADLAGKMPDISLQVDHILLDGEARERLGDLEPLAAVVSRALTEAAGRISRAHGTRPALWRYEHVHVLADRHPLAKAVPALAGLFGGRTTPVGGSGHSVCLMTPDREGAVVEGAPWRFVAELAGPGPHLRDVLRHGSSGHPLSPHYEDQTDTHSAGGLYPVDLQGAAPRTGPGLVLRPRR
ncbi:penicillin acylase family protein [Streptomyces sp. NBC_00539]|uniref:penicillin acylase family protein n=1 Tax=Streptomyces sp. NBC_00539 TaxID=2975770 RepID=UPI002E803926|nr:penicillin acylase family protein [Streptomyces sp. NBC_00539]WUC63116.1 penicillin acylase family protein [Streptomyces sp. NBC_00539]